MKTGIIMEIKNGTAIILQPGGVFTEQSARPGWEVGSVVPVHTQRTSRAVLFKRLAAIAACLALAAAIWFGGHSLLFKTVSIISIDINPSVELELNRMGRVVNATAYNEDGDNLLSALDLNGKQYDEAIPSLLQSEAMQPYLAGNVVLEFSVYSQHDEQILMAYLDAQGKAVATQYPQLQVHCSGVGQEVVQQAHEHGVSPGKMRALLELQQLVPGIDIEEYSHHSMAEIHRLIREHHGEDAPQGQEPGNGPGHGNGPDNDSGGNSQAGGDSEGGGHHRNGGRGHGS